MAIHLRTLSKIDAARPKRTVSIRSPERPDMDVPIYIPGEMEELAAERPVSLAKSVIDKVSGIALIFLGLFVVPTILVSFVLLLDRHGRPGMIDTATQFRNVFIVGMSIYMSIGCFRAAKNRLDTRRPVLLLRSHQDDGIKTKINDHLREIFNYNRLIGIGLYPYRDSLPLETLLDEELRVYGPNIALWGPKELLSRFGPQMTLWDGYAFTFARHSSAIERWQKDIFYQINRASLVVVVLGTRESLRDKHWGLAWEVATLVAMDLPHKVLLLFPPVSDEELAARWEAMKSLGVEIGLKLPAELPSEPICATFTPDWACQILPYRGRKTGDYRLALRETLVDLDGMKVRGRRAGIGAIVIGVPVLVAAYYFGGGVGDVVTMAAVASGVGASLGFVIRWAW